MKKYFDIIITKWFCCHEWDLTEEIKVYDGDNAKYPYKRKYTYICKKCGKFKMFSR